MQCIAVLKALSVKLVEHTCVKRGLYQGGRGRVGEGLARCRVEYGGDRLLAQECIVKIRVY